MKKNNFIKFIIFFNMIIAFSLSSLSYSMDYKNIEKKRMTSFLEICNNLKSGNMSKEDEAKTKEFLNAYKKNSNDPSNQTYLIQFLKTIKETTNTSLIQDLLRNIKFLLKKDEIGEFVDATIPDNENNTALRILMSIKNIDEKEKIEIFDLLIANLHANHNKKTDEEMLNFINLESNNNSSSSGYRKTVLGQLIMDKGNIYFPIKIMQLIKKYKGTNCEALNQAITVYNEELIDFLLEEKIPYIETNKKLTKKKSDKPEKELLEIRKSIINDTKTGDFDTVYSKNREALFTTVRTSKGSQEYDNGANRNDTELTTRLIKLLFQNGLIFPTPDENTLTKKDNLGITALQYITYYANIPALRTIIETINERKKEKEEIMLQQGLNENTTGPTRKNYHSESHNPIKECVQCCNNHAQCYASQANSEKLHIKNCKDCKKFHQKNMGNGCLSYIKMENCEKCLANHTQCLSDALKIEICQKCKKHHCESCDPNIENCELCKIALTSPIDMIKNENEKLNGGNEYHGTQSGIKLTSTMIGTTLPNHPRITAILKKKELGRRLTPREKGQLIVYKKTQVVEKMSDLTEDYTN